MQLQRVRIVQYGPFEELDLDLTDRNGTPRPLLVVHGDGGTGKSTVIEAIANTRPGKTSPLLPSQRRDLDAAHALCEWRLGLEEPERPHPLCVVSPNVRLDDASEQMRRREQAQYDRAAAQGPGFVFVEIPSQRYFSRSSLSLSDPARTMTRYDPRGQAPAYETNRPDLTRPCKQALSYAGICAALNRQGEAKRTTAEVLGRAMDSAVGEMANLVGYSYAGIDAHSLEPMFETAGGSLHTFEMLPTQLRHLIAFVAIPIRASWAGHSGADPRITECFVAIDDFEQFLSPYVLSGLFGVLRRSMPRAQWLLTTSSPYAAAAVNGDCLLSLRREPESDQVQLYLGDQARTH